MGLITASGIGSNVDVDSIITALVDARRIPATDRLDFQELRAEASISGVGSLSSALDLLKTSLSSLSSTTDFSKRAATSSDNNFVTVTAGSSATPANFSIDVLKIAKGTRLESGLFADSTDTVGTGNLTFTAGTNAFNVAIAATDTLSEIRDKINDAASNFGINANIINGDSGTILVLDSSITGSANSLVVTNDNVSLDSISTNLITPVGGAADDAQISINGQTITNSTNAFTDAIEDVSINAVEVTTDSIAIDVTLDTAAVKSQIQSFVNFYNEFITTVSSLGSANLDAPGILVGDATLRIVENQIRRIVGGSVSGISSSITSLSGIGITTGDDGKFIIDDVILSSAVTDNIDDIEQIFSSENGISKSLEGLIKQYTDTNTGILSTRTKNLNDTLSDIANERVDLSAKLTSLEARLRAQYGAMDALVAQLNNTGSFLTQQLANLPGFTKKASN
jgi:flagellar hook-associated protein 2